MPASWIGFESIHFKLVAEFQTLNLHEFLRRYFHYLVIEKKDKHSKKENSRSSPNSTNQYSGK